MDIFGAVRSMVKGRGRVVLVLHFEHQAPGHQGPVWKTDHLNWVVVVRILFMSTDDLNRKLQTLHYTTAGRVRRSHRGRFAENEKMLLLLGNASCTEV